MEMFARFFELQTMLSIYNEHQAMLSDVNRTRLNLLETIKSVNKKRPRLAQQITQTREAAKAFETKQDGCVPTSRNTRLVRTNHSHHRRQR